MNTSKPVVTLFFRRNRGAGNFSIEASFSETQAHFPETSRFTLRMFESSYLSNGIANRVKAIIEARRQATEINHVTGDVHYLALGVPKQSAILTIHDCGFLDQPARLKRRALKLVWLDLPVRHCRFITAVSQATKNDVVRLTGCPESKVVVIPTTVPSLFQRSEKPFNTDCPRFLHIGLTPNKNFARHVEALSGIPCHLQVIGRLTEEHLRLLKQHKINYSHAHNISQDELQRAYSESDALLFASTLEGFGMPIIEAQTVGRPVITSEISSMPEIAGPDGALFVNPNDVESIRSAIKSLIGNDRLRQVLVETGLKNVKRFDASTIARQYEALYERVASEPE